MRSAARRLVIGVCPRERGCVSLPVKRGARARRLNAAALARALGRLIKARGLTDVVTVQAACAGGCTRPGPNVSVTTYPASRPGEPVSHVAVGWKTYVYSLGALDCLERILDANLH